VTRVQALALRVIAERLEHPEAPAEILSLTSQARREQLPSVRARRALGALKIAWQIKRRPDRTAP
jgi:hypothetical protein